MSMSEDIKRYGFSKSGAGGQNLPFSRATQADGWLYVSGQVPMDENGELIGGNIITQTKKTMENLISILDEAGYTVDDVVRCGIWLDDTRDFWSMNKVYKEYFKNAAPSRACVQSSMMVDCKVEIDCIAYRSDKK